MTQSDHEIKTISQKTIARDFSQRDILSEGKIENHEAVVTPEETPENMTRREAFRNLLPSAGRGLAGILRRANQVFKGDL